MYLFDIIIFVILLYCIVRGVFRGLLKEMSSLVGVLGGFYAAYTYYTEAGKYLGRWITNTDYLNIISFSAIFICVFLVISILGIIIKYILKVVFLGWVDRFFGAIFGIIKGILIGSVILLVFTAFYSGSSKIISSSKTAPYLAFISNKMIKVTPKDLKREYQTKIKEIEKDWEKKITEPVKKN
jgi:membrane protein required for colicin V production